MKSSFFRIVPPNVSVTPHSESVWAGCPASFKCTVTGWPIPTIQWTHDGKDVDTGSRKNFTYSADRRESTLRIPHAYVTDQGTYTYSADNFVGEAPDSVQLTVTRKSAVNELTIFNESAFRGIFWRFYYFNFSCWIKGFRGS